MFSPEQYQLLDFGSGRKLERFGAVTLDRPSPAAEGVRPAMPVRSWNADARFERTSAEQGKWLDHREVSESWNVVHDPLHFERRRTDFGHVGMFPEQAANWDWIAAQGKRLDRPLRVLNLFAYTGGSTLAAAAAGAEVVHIDAAKNVFAWARQNAELSGLSSAPIRWIIEDAARFVRRELKRGNRYDAVILDPPSYGHGPAGEAWQIDRCLEPLLDDCVELTLGSPKFMLLTCHSPGYGPAELEAMLQARVHHMSTKFSCGEMALETADGRRLSSGAFARVMLNVGP